MKKTTTLKRFLFLLVLLCSSVSGVMAQCPTITSVHQSFCDLQSPTVADLIANDSGNGVVWYPSASSTTSLASGLLLSHGATYFVDDNSGSCGDRQSVYVTIYTAPTGPSFQTPCVENAAEATIGVHLALIGNSIQWYNVPEGGVPLLPSTQITGNTIYYASQINPFTGCETSRKAVYVDEVVIILPPQGDPIQYFCNDSGNIPTLTDMVVSAPGVRWYSSMTSVVQLPITTPLVDGATYFVASVNEPCISTTRLAVTVEFMEMNHAGESTLLALCDYELSSMGSTLNLFDNLSNGGSTISTSGVWTGDVLLSNGYLGTIDLSTLAQDITYVFTYTVTDSSVCDAAESTVSILINSSRDPGLPGTTLPICPTSTDDVDLFSYLNGTPDAGGFWEPALSSGTSIFNPANDSFGVYTYTFNDGCSDTATVNVIEQVAYDPGSDGDTPPICYSSTDDIDLFDYLNGTPDTGGIWTPALSSGTSIFNPVNDSFGVYTYSFNDSCTIATATVTVVGQQIYDPGLDGDTPPICSTSTDDVDLFGYLNGTPDVGGFWEPALSSGTSIFNPVNDSFGVYTYTFNDGCSDTAMVNVIEQETYDPGLDGATPPICYSSTAEVDLFDYLNGTPDTGGVWTPALSSGTSIFNPVNDSFGVYTYSFNDNCTVATATITVVEQQVYDPGLDGDTPPICPASTDYVDLFSYLNGTPDAGGIWVPALASGTGIFNASHDAFGVYTYMFDDGCTVDTATVVVVMENTPSPGISNDITICPDEIEVVDLFEVLLGTPDVGGTWVPALASGTGVFDPTQDVFGIYTYTFNNGCSLDATVTVFQGDVQDPGLDGETPPICPASTDYVDLFSHLNGTPDVGGVWVPALASGTGIFNAANDYFGVYTYMFDDGCTVDTATVNVVMENTPNPGISDSVAICPGDTATIDLFILLGNTADSGGTWVPALASGTGVFDPTQDVFGIYTYTFNNGCSLDATITVFQGDVQDPGLDGDTPPICPASTDDVDLFDHLNGTPDVGGIWVPALASGTGIFNAANDSFGVYTYMFDDGCTVDTATVTVVMENTPNPGISDSVAICPGDTATVDLFVLLGNTADSGGTWVPALVSGTGMFDPTQDVFGIYTYTFNNGCSLDATVTVFQGDVQDPGLDGDTSPICPASTDDVDLFSYLNGTPDVGGIWVPALASGTGIFNAANDSFGVYTYMFDDGCTVDTATVTVVMENTPNPGISDSVAICPGDTATVDLFVLLGNTADSGGTWVPALASGTGVFDPTQDIFGIYTYTFNNNCSLDATVTVLKDVVQDPGIDGVTPPICPASTDDVDLFSYLNGTPDVGGIWVPALASGTGIFNASNDTFGVYTYMFDGGCTVDTATVTIVMENTFDPGESNVLPPICPDDTALIDLFSRLGGTPDVGGVWVPALASGTGIFDPTQDSFGVYTYTFNDDCSLEATIEVLQGVVYNPGDSEIIPPVCSNDTSLIDLFSYLGGTPDVGGVWVPALVSGTGVFNPLVDSFGVYTYMFADDCSPDTATITITSQPTFDSGTSNSYEFCPKEIPTVDLFTLLGGTPDVGGVWVPALASGTGVFDPLVDSFGDYIYTFNDDCSNTATITVIENCGIIIPDGFSPNQDGINDFFEIKNLRNLYPDFKIEIFNRYGNSLFKGNASKPDWDGTSSDSMLGDGTLPVGVYFFILEFNDGEKKPLQGRLYLSR